MQRAAVLIGSTAMLMPASPAGSACREPAGEPPVRWVSLGRATDAPALDRWCAGVGAPVLTGPQPAPPTVALADGLAVVVWNVHVGAGAVEELIRELRAGDLTGGRRVHHFVLLLQEAVRVGSAVPDSPAKGAVSARGIGRADRERSIDALARRAGLFGFYAPSMRNGAGQREDRGNAILATLPLSDPAAIELPYERQRRVAVSARVAVPHGDGSTSALRLVSVHLDNASHPARFWRSFGAGRAHQARALVDFLDREEHVVVGGDFNTWFGESGEEALRVLRRRFPAQRFPKAATYAPPYGLPARQVDYLLLDLPGGWEGSYRVSVDRRDSDHAPLIGWLRSSEARAEPAEDRR